MAEPLVVEGLEDNVDLLFEERAVGLLVGQRRAEGLDLARMIAASDTKRDAAAGEDVDGGEILGEAQRVPHRRDVEAAADLDVAGLVGEVQGHQDGVGNALRALGLEMMLGHPEAVVAEPIHDLGHVLGLAERRRQMLVAVAAVVGGRAGIADVIEVGMASIQAVELGDHGGVLAAGG